MAKETEMKVFLLGWTYNPELVVGVAINRCYSDLPTEELIKRNTPEKTEKLIENVESRGHTSTIEHAFFNFAVEGISRAAAQQITRHRLASYSMESMRYVDLSKKELEVVVPEPVKKSPEAQKIYMESANQGEAIYKELLARGIKPEDARGRLGLDTECKMVFSMNARELTEVFFTERLCRLSQAEIRNLAIVMAKLVRKEAPKIFKNIGPTCKKDGICWEGNKSCGLWKSVEGGILKERRKHQFKEGVNNELSFLDENG